MGVGELHHEDPPLGRHGLQVGGRQERLVLLQVRVDRRFPRIDIVSTRFCTHVKCQVVQLYLNIGTHTYILICISSFPFSTSVAFGTTNLIFIIFFGSDFE